MYKSLGEKVRDYFIKMGKNHRILLPIAVIGLAVTMLILNLANYVKNGYKRIGSAVFVVGMFLIGNSFAYPIFNQDTGFVTAPSANEEEVPAADDTVIDLAPEEYISAGYEDFFDSEDDLSEYGLITESQIVSYEDIIGNIDQNISLSEGDAGVSNSETGFDASDWKLVLVNKQHPIPDDYSFTLGNLSSYMQCDERIIEPLLSMMKKAQEDGVTLVICSPYRDSEKQEKLFNRKINAYMKKGYSYMDAYKLSSQAVTVPGSSEHQIGLAIDLITKGYNTLDEGFAETEAGKWLKEHCDEFGFILRYPKDKEYITGIEWEPWHFRYVGNAAASVIMEQNISLEEFWNNYL